MGSKEPKVGDEYSLKIMPNQWYLITRLSGSGVVAKTPEGDHVIISKQRLKDEFIKKVK